MTRKARTVLELALAPHVRSERAEEQLCDSLIGRLGGAIIRFSQPRNTMQTLGIPDRRYRLRGRCWWWELKKADGKLSSEQRDFLVAELAYGERVGVGTLEDLLEFLDAMKLNLEAAFGRDLIEKYRHKPRPAARGKVRRRAR